MQNIESKLRQEFVDVDQPRSGDDFDAIVVLCAWEVEVDGEEKERIDESIKIISTSKSRLPLIFLGTLKHIETLEKYLKSQEPSIKPIYPTRYLEDSTMTQIKSLNHYLADNPIEKILLITHAYHLPRVRRYCAKYLPKQKIEFLSVGKIADQRDKIDGEIERIIRYAEQGNLILNIDGR